METKVFENIIISGEGCKRIWDFSVEVISFFIVIMIVLTVASRMKLFNVKIPIMWYINLPKMFIYGMAVFYVFCYDFNTQTPHLPRFDDMLLSTFLVGILAIIELLTILASIINDICDMIKKW